MPSKVENKLAILSYHEKRIQLEQEVQQRYENLSEEAQAVIRDTIREFIRRSAMPVRIIYAQKFVEELENRLFEKNQAFQQLSKTHEQTLADHKAQIDVLQDKGDESEKIQQLRLQLSTRESELDQKALELSESKQKLLDQAKRHQQRVDELKAEMALNSEPIMAEIGSTLHMGFMVSNWRDGWKWISNWCFGLIVFFATTPIPPELLLVLPENVRMHLIAWVAFCGFVGRYLNQSKGAPLWPLKS